MYTEPPSWFGRARKRADARRGLSAAFQWASSWASRMRFEGPERGSENGVEESGKRFKYAETTPGALVGTKWRVMADVGRESGTWMPPNRRRRMRLVLRWRWSSRKEAWSTHRHVAFTPTTFAPGRGGIEGDTLIQLENGGRIIERTSSSARNRCFLKRSCGAIRSAPTEGGCTRQTDAFLHTTRVAFGGHV